MIELASSSDFEAAYHHLVSTKSDLLCLYTVQPEPKSAPQSTQQPTKKSKNQPKILIFVFQIFNVYFWMRSNFSRQIFQTDFPDRLSRQIYPALMCVFKNSMQIDRCYAHAMCSSCDYRYETDVGVDALSCVGMIGLRINSACVTPRYCHYTKVHSLHPPI